MTRRKLIAQFNSAGVNPRAYALDGGTDLDEAYVLAHEGGQWSVYYSERGIRSGCESSQPKKPPVRPTFRHPVTDGDARSDGTRKVGLLTPW